MWVLILKVPFALKIKIAVEVIGVKLTWNSPGKILGMIVKLVILQLVIDCCILKKEGC
jgi:hypothetical protein